MRSLKKVTIETGSLRASDYRVLGRMDLMSAKEFVFIFTRFF
jgi:hypothetical protein